MRGALDFRERTKVRRIVYSKPTILILVLLTALTLRGAWGMYQKSVEAKANRDKAVAEENSLLAREKELHTDVVDLSSDRGKEEEIRNRFMVAKEGEKVIIVSQPDQDAVHSVTVDDTTKPSLVDELKAAVGLSNN